MLGEIFTLVSISDTSPRFFSFQNGVLLSSPLLEAFRRRWGATELLVKITPFKRIRCFGISTPWASFYKSGRGPVITQGNGESACQSLCELIHIITNIYWVTIICQACHKHNSKRGNPEGTLVRIVHVTFTFDEPESRIWPGTIHSLLIFEKKEI